MATTSFSALRRFAGIGFTLLFSLCLCVEAAGQGVAPAVISATATGPFNSATANGVTFGQVWNMAVSSHGDLLLLDFKNGVLYQVPANGGPTITISNGLCGWTPVGIALDSSDNVFVPSCWADGLTEIPYDAVNHTWNYANNIHWGTTMAGQPDAGWSASAGQTHAWMASAIAINSNNLMAIGLESWTPNSIMTVQESSVAADGSGGTATVVVTGLSGRPATMGIDNAGDIVFTEDGGAQGVYWIPAGTTNVSGEGSLLNLAIANGSPTGVTMDAVGNVYIFDSNIGIYEVPNENGTPNPKDSFVVSVVPGDGAGVAGLAIDRVNGRLVVPTTQSFTPAVQWHGIGYFADIEFNSGEAGSSPVGTQSSKILPVIYTFNKDVTPARFVIQENGVATPDFSIVSGGTCAAGTTYPNTDPTTQKVTNSCFLNVAFNPQHLGSVSAQLLVQTSQTVPSGSANAIAAVTGYSASGKNLILIANNGFVPGELITFKVTSADSTKPDPLTPLDDKSFYVLPTGLSATQFEIQSTAVTGSGSKSENDTIIVTGKTIYSTVGTTTLHGTGLASAIQTTPALESTIGGGLKTPSQLATDLWGNLYIADPGLKQVLMYPAGSSSSIAVPTSTELTAPTGVAVDGNGDVFIADSGSVYEVPFAFGALYSAQQTTLASGLGSNLRLAADGVGHLYVADPDNARVVELYNLNGASIVIGQSEVYLTSGFTAPSFVAVDAANNLFVIDGANLLELSKGSLATLTNSLSNATGLAIDPSGAVYISSTGGTVRVPYVSGAFNFGNSAPIAAGVSNPTGIAIDNLANVYLTDGTALNVHVVTTNGSVVLPTPPTLTSSTTTGVTITNAGNVALNLTGYTSTNPVDYTGVDVSCISGSPVAPGNTCQAEVLFNPGPGEEGPLAGQIGIESDAIDIPAVIQATGVGLPLPKSVSTITVGSKPEVISTPVTVTVKAQSGTGVPTGLVTVSYTTWQPLTCPGNNDDPAPCPGKVAESVPLPTTATMTVTLTDGSATLNLPAVMAGNANFSVAYGGDRAFGRSTATTTGIVAKSAITGLSLPDPATLPSYLPYVLESNGFTPYNLSAIYTFSFKVTVNTPVGVPTGILTFMDKYQADVSPTLTTGPACPAGGNGVQPLSLTGWAQLGVSCLPMPQNVTYGPVASTHIITPVYSGDSNFLPYTGTVTTTFIAVRSPAVAITANPTSLTVKAGSSASATLTLDSILGYGYEGKNSKLNNYVFPVSLACSNLPAHTTCSFTYSPDANLATYGLSTGVGADAAATAVNILCTGTTGAAPNCATSLPVTLTINTNVPVGTTTSQLARSVPVSFAAIFGFGMVGLCFQRRLARKWQTLLMFLLVIFGGGLAVSLTACSTTNLSPASVLTTPVSGSTPYSVIVTAQQVGSQMVTNADGTTERIAGSQNQMSLPFTLNLTVQ
jgi:hypothetical protein